MSKFVNGPVSGKTDGYINIRMATSFLKLCFQTGITRSRGNPKKIQFSVPVAQQLGKYKACSTLIPSIHHSRKHIRTVHSEIHMHTNPTPRHKGPLWSHKTENNTLLKNTQGTRNSLLNQSNHGASGRAHSLSRAPKAHFNAVSMFYDKKDDKHANRECYVALPSRDRPAR